jgi:outer membrane protein
MSKFMKTGSFLIIALLCTVALQAQKFGYINSQAMMSELPKVKQADSDMEAYQKQLQKKGQDMVTAFQTKVTDFQKRVQDGLVPPKQQEEEEKKLEEERQKILAYEQEMTQLLQTKRDALLKPILDEFNAAVKAVATEGGYTYIFDQGILLYFDATMDVAPMVKKKLGITQ